MRLRKLALAVGLAGAMGADFASALGLGEIKLLSRLNQPLEAEIKLLQVRDLNEDEIRIVLASGTDFEKAGIDRVYFLSSLKFDVDLKAAGGPVVRVTSPQPVREPYLNFLLETQWPSGRILREYTVLMDLPVFGDETARPVEVSRGQPATATKAPVSRPEPAAAPTEAQAATSEDAAEAPPAKKTQAEPVQTASRGGDVYGPVSANDTLWAIALKVRPGREFSVQQTMLAIQRLNPEAFIDGNINLLRRGQVLRVPTSDQIAQLSKTQAISEVAQQNDQWGGAATGPQLDASKSRSGGAVADGGVSGRLKVAAAESSSGASSGRAAGEASSGDGAQVESLQNDLAISMEELDRSRRENSQLKGQVQELQDQIDTMERLLEVSSQELAALQLAAGQKAEASDTGAAGEVVKETVAPAPAEEVGGEAVPPAAEAAPVVKEKKEPQKPAADKKKPDPTKVVVSSRQEPGFMDMVMDNIAYVAGGVAALLLAGLLLLRRRKQEEPADSEELELAFDDVTDAEVDNAFDEVVMQELAAEDDQDDFDFDAGFESDPDEAPEATRSQTEDVVGEADIYISLGKFAEAEDMLLNALESDPTNDAARFKLLEVYAETKNQPGFEKQYSALQITADAATIARAGLLSEQFGGLASFGDADDMEAGDLGALEFTLGDDPSDSGADEAATGDLEFDLSDEFSVTADQPAADEDLTLDFNLDADADTDTLDFNLDADADADTLEFSLDDAGSEEVASDDLSLDLASDLESLDFDSDTGSEEGGEALGFGDDLDFSLNDQGSVEPGLSEADAKPEEPVEFDSFDSFELDDSSLELADSAPAAPDLSQSEPDLGDDAFDVDLDSLDLDALDQELDALSADADLAQLDETFDSGDLAGDFELPAGGDDSFSDGLAEDDSWLDNAADSAQLDADLEMPELDAMPDFAEPAQESVELSGDGLTDLPSPEDVLGGDDDLDADLDFLADTDEVATKLDLARAYIDMGDRDGARDILDEVVAEGSDQQRQEAQELISRMG
ncbi:FimV/HubP family polar landmark protein [Pseudomaricurvus sp. HS19]|uniref:FimV/HubP family polar landmark protein n=1 Tax=Pseudomaricurvus sp. HS19 TaxID=2692626 RepID=UPI00136DED1B|nr:FimV/HubP family polar landmark protein [Pseudomaricurvus sp. HS19]MYM62728.1 LPXTG cell wall anchor domain-containing protein [Pseudomaricurvus sp. HS19]